MHAFLFPHSFKCEFRRLRIKKHENFMDVSERVSSCLHYTTLYIFLLFSLIFHQKKLYLLTQAILPQQRHFSFLTRRVCRETWGREKDIKRKKCCKFVIIEGDKIFLSDIFMKIYSLNFFAYLLELNSGKIKSILLDILKLRGILFCCNFFIFWGFLRIL